MLISKNEFAKRCGFIHKVKGHVEGNKLSVYVTRGKIHATGDYIDDEDPVNVLFMEYWQRKNGIDGSESIPDLEPTPQPIKKPTKKPPKRKPAKKTPIAQKETVKREAPKEIKPKIEKPKPVKPKVTAPKVVKPKPQKEHEDLNTRTFQTEAQQRKADNKETQERLRDLEEQKKMADLSVKQLEAQRKAFDLQRLQGLYVPTGPLKNLFMQYKLQLIQGFKGVMNRTIDDIIGMAELPPEMVVKIRKKTIEQINAEEEIANDLILKQLDTIIATDDTK
jgi:hypothetical protein